MTHPDWARLLAKVNCNPPANAAAIQKFETDSGITLPADYRMFLMRCDGGEGFLGEDDDGPNVMLWRVEELIEMNKAYEITEHAPWLVVFGSDGGGEALAFDLRSGAMPIISLPFIGFDETTVWPLAPNFADFLQGNWPPLEDE